MLVERIAEQANLSIGFVKAIVQAADHLYRTYEIDKASGGGKRTIHHPAKKLKFLQRWVARTIFSQLPQHITGTAYRKGTSIRDNVSPHSANNFLLRMDIKNFFPSLVAHNIASLLSKYSDSLELPLSAEDIEDITKIVCRFGELTIGAPSSPMISNCLMHEFDCHWSVIAAHNDCCYTRYADDIIFSTNTPGVLEGICRELSSAPVHPGDLRFEFNPKKTIFSSRKHRRSVTGLILTSENKVSLGRDRKRQIKSMVFLSANGSLDKRKLQHLRGLLAYANSAEPEFLDRLRRKFGEQVVSSLVGQRISLPEPTVSVAPSTRSHSA